MDSLPGGLEAGKQISQEAGKPGRWEARRPGGLEAGKPGWGQGVGRHKIEKP